MIYRHHVEGPELRWGVNPIPQAYFFQIPLPSAEIPFPKQEFRKTYPSVIHTSGISCMSWCRMRKKTFGNSGVFGFNVSVVDRVSMFAESVFEKSITFPYVL